MALRDQPYIPLYVQDFLTDEKLIECSAESTGVYIRLICIMHKSIEYGTILLKQKDKQTESIYLNFANKLAKQLPYNLEIIEKSLKELVDEGVIEIKDDKLLQKRMIRDNDISLKRSVAGKKGGEKSKFAQAKVKAKVVANSENENEYENEYENININKNRKEYTEKFLEFYEKYPVKKSKMEAQKAFNKALKSIAFETIMKGVDNLNTAVKMKKVDPGFIKHPSTWLNQGCWDDVYEVEKKEIEFKDLFPEEAKLMEVK